MKFLNRSALVAVFLMLCTSAHATYCTNGGTNWPTCTPPTPTQPPPSTSTSNSSATAAANAAANASQHQEQQQAQGQQQSAIGIGQGGNATAAGGSARQGQEANSGASITDNSNGGSFKSNMWVLPAPVFTPPLPMISGCPGANVEQFAAAIGWSFASIAKATVNTDSCTAITLYNSYVSTCKYASAQQVLDLLSAKVLPGFRRADVVLVDLRASECSAMLAPVTNITNVRYETISAPPAPRPVVVPKKRKSDAKPCERVLSTVWQCKRAGT